MRIAGWNRTDLIWFTEDDVTPGLGKRRIVWPHLPVQSGFSMIEAMTVLAIIVALGAASIPSIRSGLSHLKLARAVDAFVDQIEFARAQAATRNRAYRVQVIMGQGLTRGRVIVTEGWGTVCNELNFKVSGGFEPVVGIRDVDFTDEHPGAMITDIQPSEIITADEDDYVGLCFKPDGRVLQVTEGADGGGDPIVPAPDGYGAGEAVYKISLLGEDAQVDSVLSTARNIVVPYNGIPRVEQFSPEGGS